MNRSNPAPKPGSPVNPELTNVSGTPGKNLLLAGTVLVLLLVFVLWLFKGFFQKNHILFLLNQREYAPALTALRELSRPGKTDPRLLLLQTKAYALTEQYQEAISTSAGSDSLFSASPEILYWRALAQYQSGDTTGSRLSATVFLKTNTQLPNGGRAVAKAMAEPASVIESPDVQKNRFKLLFPIEQATYLSLIFAQQMELGRFDTAQDYARRAFLAGNRNRGSLVKSAEVSALTGEFHDARMYLDHAGAGSVKQLRSQLEKQQIRRPAVSLSLETPDLNPGKREIDIARARAWSVLYEVETLGSSQGAGSLETFPSETLEVMLATFPADPVIQSFHARSIAKSSPDVAEGIWAQLQQTHPSYSTLLHLASVRKSSPSDILASGTGFLSPLHPLKLAPVGGASKKGPGDPVYDLTDEKPLEFTALVKEHGTYSIAIAARPHEGSSCLCVINVDSEPVGLVYVAGGQWECYTVNVAIEPGEHTLGVSVYSPPGALAPPEQTAEVLTVVLTPASAAPVP